MGYKKEIKIRIADIMATRLQQLDKEWNVPSSLADWCKMNSCINTPKSTKPLVPRFYIMDSSIEKYLTVFMPRADIPHFIRKAGMFGMIWEKGLCIPVGDARKDWDALQIHIVTDDDCMDILPTSEKSLDVLDQFKT